MSAHRLFLMTLSVGFLFTPCRGHLSLTCESERYVTEQEFFTDKGKSKGEVPSLHESTFSGQGQLYIRHLPKHQGFAYEGSVKSTEVRAN